MDNLWPFKFPKPVKITGRSSTITNAFVTSIIPLAEPTEDEVEHALEKLGMTRATCVCAYCGGKFSEWDHLRPLVKDKRPTGFISEIRNLVPACGKCNQSKGNKDWRVWIESSAKGSPRSREVEDLNQRIQRLEDYERWGSPERVVFEDIVGAEDWRRYWAECESLHSRMRDVQCLSDIIRDRVVRSRRGS
jgi:hypothetical protein